MRLSGVGSSFKAQQTTQLAPAPSVAQPQVTSRNSITQPVSLTPQPSAPQAVNTLAATRDIVARAVGLEAPAPGTVYQRLVAREYALDCLVDLLRHSSGRESDTLEALLTPASWPHGSPQSSAVLAALVYGASFAVAGEHDAHGNRSRAFAFTAALLDSCKKHLSATGAMGPYSKWLTMDGAQLRAWAPNPNQEDRLEAVQFYWTRSSRTAAWNDASGDEQRFLLQLDQALEACMTQTHHGARHALPAVTTELPAPKPVPQEIVDKALLTYTHLEGLATRNRLDVHKARRDAQSAVASLLRDSETHGLSAVAELFNQRSWKVRQGKNAADLHLDLYIGALRYATGYLQRRHSATHRVARVLKGHQEPSARAHLRGVFAALHQGIATIPTDPRIAYHLAGLAQRAQDSLEGKHTPAVLISTLCGYAVQVQCDLACGTHDVKRPDDAVDSFFQAFAKHLKVEQFDRETVLPASEPWARAERL